MKIPDPPKPFRKFLMSSRPSPTLLLSVQSTSPTPFSSITTMDWVPLPPPINPLSAVRRTTAQVVERAVHVSLNNEALAQLAKVWANEGGAGGAGIGWNESGWHYSEDAAAGGNLTCQYVFVLGETSRRSCSRPSLGLVVSFSC